jgi:hypothetical protein
MLFLRRGEGRSQSKPIRRPDATGRAVSSALVERQEQTRIEFPENRENNRDVLNSYRILSSVPFGDVPLKQPKTIISKKANFVDQCSA